MRIVRILNRECTLSMARSFHSRQSIQGIEITEALMRKILTFYNVDAEFLHVLFSFGEVPRTSESNSRNLAIQTTSKGCKGRKNSPIGLNIH